MEGTETARRVRRTAPAPTRPPCDPRDLVYALLLAIDEVDDVETALELVLEKLCAATGWNGGQTWLLRGDELVEGPVWSSGIRAIEPEPSVSPRDLAAAACATRSTLWRGHSVAIPILSGAAVVGAFVFGVPRAAEDRTRATTLVPLAMAHLGLWLRRKGAEDRLRASEQRFRLLIEHVGDAVVLLDRHGRINTWTPTAERLFGYRADEVAGSAVTVLHGDGDDDISVAGEIGTVLGDGLPRVEGWRVRADRHRFWAGVLTLPIHAEDGALTGFTQIIRDLTAAPAAAKSNRRRLQVLASSACRGSTRRRRKMPCGQNRSQS